jgi:hypothetical protein
MQPDADVDAVQYAIGDSPLGARREDQLDLAAAPEYQLFFSCFLGRVRLRLGGADLSTRGDGLATLAFALVLAREVGELGRAGRATVDFQEGGGSIDLVLDGDLVHASASYTDAVGSTRYEDLRRLAGASLRELVATLSARYPALRANQALARQVDAALRLVQ